MTQQLIYDLGVAKLSDRYLARKHDLPIAKIRAYRKEVRLGLDFIKKGNRERKKERKK